MINNSAESIDVYMNVKMKVKTKYQKNIDRKQHRLHLAVQNQRYQEIMNTLIISPANVQDQNGLIPLHLAAERGDQIATRILLQCNSNPNAKSYRCLAPLMYAIKSNSTDTAKLLIDAGADVNETIHHYDGTIFTYLHSAVFMKNLNMVKLLLRNRARVNEYDNNNLTPLCIGIMVEHEGIVSILLARGAQIHASLEDRHAHRPLFLAMCPTRDSIFQLLVRNAKRFDELNDCGVGLLHYAVETNQLDKLRLLIDHGADVDMKTREGRTPLQRAVLNGNYEAAIILCEAGADVIKSDGVYTPMQAATTMGSDLAAEIIELLVKCGADVNSVSDDFNVRPLALAHIDQPEVIRMLLRYGGNFRPGERSTMLGLAKPNADKNDIETCIELLLLAGLDTYEIYDLAKTSPDNNYIVRCALRYVVKRDVAGLYRNSMLVRKMKERQMFQGLRRKCCRELKRMRRTILYDDVTWYDFLTPTKSMLCHLGQQREFCNIFDRRMHLDKFPIYGNILEFRYYLARKSKLINETMSCMAFACNNILPDLVIGNLMYFLNDRDMRYFVGAVNDARNVTNNNNNDNDNHNDNDS